MTPHLPNKIKAASRGHRTAQKTLYRARIPPAVHSPLTSSPSISQSALPCDLRPASETDLAYGLRLLVLQVQLLLPQLRQLAVGDAALVLQPPAHLKDRVGWVTWGLYPAACLMDGTGWVTLGRFPRPWQDGVEDRPVEVRKRGAMEYQSEPQWYGVPPPPLKNGPAIGESAPVMFMVITSTPNLAMSSLIHHLLI